MDNAILQALRNAAGAITALDEQIEQMRGMFDDKDGTIAAALEAGAESLGEIRAAIETHGSATDQPSTPVSEGLSAAALLVHAYIAGEALHGGSVDWEDVNEAHTKAREELGPSRVAEIEAVYVSNEAENGGSK